MAESDSDATEPEDQDWLAAWLVQRANSPPAGAKDRGSVGYSTSRETECMHVNAPTLANTGAADGSGFSMAMEAQYNLAMLGPWRREKISVDGTRHMYSAPDPYSSGRISCDDKPSDVSGGRCFRYYNSKGDPISFAGPAYGFHGPPRLDQTPSPAEQVAAAERKWVRRSRRRRPGGHP